MEPRYHHSIVGGNFRLDEVQGAILEIKLGHLQNYANARRKNAAYYARKLDSIANAERLILPTREPENFHIWNQFTLRVQNGERDALRDYLRENGVASEIYYPVPMHRQPCFAGAPQKSPRLETTEKLAREVLSIPIFPELREEQLAYVAEQIKAFFAT